jgi:hypothetical protein
MARLTLIVQDEELEALYTLAERECRDTRAQAVFILRQELQRQGLLPVEDPPVRPAASPPPIPDKDAAYQCSSPS